MMGVKGSLELVRILGEGRLLRCREEMRNWSGRDSGRQGFQEPQVTRLNERVQNARVGLKDEKINILGHIARLVRSDGEAGCRVPRLEIGLRVRRRKWES
jgi:hypothetical protein